MRYITHQEGWREEVFDEPKFDGVIGVLQDAENHDRGKALGQNMSAQNMDQRVKSTYFIE